MLAAFSLNPDRLKTKKSKAIIPNCRMCAFIGNALTVTNKSKAVTQAPLLMSRPHRDNIGIYRDLYRFNPELNGKCQA
jgi:hypothetical protein